MEVQARARADIYPSRLFASVPSRRSGRSSSLREPRLCCGERRRGRGGAWLPGERHLQRSADRHCDDLARKSACRSLCTLLRDGRTSVHARGIRRQAGRQLIASKRLEQAARAPGVGAILLTDRAKLEQVLEYVTQANSIEMADRALTKELKG